MAMRVLRSRKSTSSDTGEREAAGPSSGLPKLIPRKITRSSSKDVTSASASNSGDELDEDEDEYPALPLFGLSELAFAGADNQSSTSGLGLVQIKKKRVRNPPREPVICPTCGKNFTRKAHLVRHMYLHTGEKPFKCAQCDQTFNRKDHLRSHIRGHAETKEFQCNHCHCSFRRPDLLRVHVLKNHGKYQKTFKPATTSKMSSELEEINYTGQKVARTVATLGFKILTCSQCNKRFTQDHLYRAHLASHSKQKDSDANNARNMADAAITEENYDETNFEDEDEGDDDGNGDDDDDDGEDGFDDEGDDDIPLKSATRSQIQDMLTRQLNQPRKFECVVCAKIFKEQRSLRRHYKIHKRNFTCRFCGIRMSSAGSLMRHNLLHTGEKPFHCELCDRRFSRKDALKAHLVAHEKESHKVQLARPYRCTYCSARYTMRYNLIRHIRQSHQLARARRSTFGIQQQQQQHEVENEEDNNELEDDNQLLDEEVEGSAEDSLKCKHCGKVFANHKSLSTHVWYHSQEKRFVCRICNHGFKYATDLNRHYLTHRGRKVTNITQLMAQNRLAQAKQAVKGGPMQRAQPTHNSILVNGQRLYPCGVCGQIFNHRSNRSRHMRLFHKGSNEGGSRAPAQAHRQQRQASIISEQVIQQQPNIKTETGVTIKREIKSPSPASGSMGIPAKLSQQQRQSRESLDSNNDNDDDQEQPNFNGMFKCCHCEKVFTKRYNYKLHMRTHNKQFACLVCGLRTASQGDLTLHIRTHTGEKPFKCTKCDWRFCRRSALTVHYRRHHGPNAKIKRHYNPQRVTPNMMQLDPDAAVQLAPDSEETNADNSILKTMLENTNPIKVEEEEKPLPTRQPPRKNLPPPPPLIRYPGPAGFKTSPGPQKIESGEEDDQEGENPADLVFLCRPCGTMITGKNDYVKHMLTEHGATVSVSSNKQATKPGLPSLLPALQQRPKVSQKQPEVLQVQQATPCRQCGEMFGSRHDLTVHALVAHATENSPVTCGVCRKNCSTIDFLSRHYQYVHPKVKNAAEEARQLMLNTADDLEEMYVDNNQHDTAPANLLCPEVVINEEEEDFVNPEEMYNDFEGDFPAPEAILETEADNFIGNPEQSTSRQSTDANLPYPCPLCNKRFKDKKALADHKWYHSREAIHPCTICGKRFKLKNDLIRHHRRHLQERPHMCPEEGCDSRFYQKLDLDRHLAKVHHQLENMPYACEHCPSRFAQPGTLVRHMRSSHPDKDVSQLLLLQMHSQKRKAEEQQMQEFLDNLPPEEEEHHVEGNGNSGDEKDYSFELQQLEIDMSTEEDGNGNEYLVKQTSNTKKRQNYVSPELDIQEADEELEQYEDDQFWVKGQQIEEGEMSMPGTSSSLLQPCMKRLEEYTNERGELFCKPCNKHFKDLKTLQNHVYYHQREMKHACVDCGAKFKQKSDLRRHIGIHHDPNKRRQCISCPNCNRSFTDERYLRIHLNRNCEGTPGDGESEFYQQDFEEGQGMEAAINTGAVADYDEGNDEGQQLDAWEEGEEFDPSMFVASDLQADGDEYYGEDYEQMQEEEQVAHEVEQSAFECDICGAFFSRSNELILHKRNHAKATKTFPFTSTSASASSSKRAKVFSCDKCGVSFIQKAELTQHLQTYHLDELPIHQCQFCPKFFYVKKSLDTHRRRHHSHLMNLHPCKVCGAKFSQVEYLATHMKSHHSNHK